MRPTGGNTRSYQEASYVRVDILNSTLLISRFHNKALCRAHEIKHELYYSDNNQSQIEKNGVDGFQGNIHSPVLQIWHLLAVAM